MTGKSKWLMMAAILLAAMLPATDSAGQLKAESSELDVGAVEVQAGRNPVVKGAGVFPEAALELERVEGPPVSIRFDRIHRLVFKEVTRVEREKESMQAAFYRVERVGGGSGIEGFIRASRSVTFEVRTKAWTRRFVIGPGNPVKNVVFTGNMNRVEKGLDEKAGQKDFVLGRASKEYTVVVPGNTRWMATGITLTRDQVLHFTANGTIKWGTDPVGKEVGPDGRPDAGRQGRPMPGNNLGMLIARFRPLSERPYVVGSEKSLKAPVDSELELGINDDNLTDNTGNFRVRIVVDPN